MTDADDELLASARLGDRQAIARLLERYGQTVRRRIAGRIPRRWRALLSEDDVMQQTYADAVLGLGRFQPRGPGSFLAWLTCLAECNLRGALRMLGARKRGGRWRRMEPGGGDLAVSPRGGLLAVTSSTPSRRVALIEARSTMANALSSLPASYRRVIELYDLEERPIDEVAAELHRSEGAVYMLRARAHERLAEAMGRPSEFFTDAP